MAEEVSFEKSDTSKSIEGELDDQMDMYLPGFGSALSTILAKEPLEQARNILYFLLDNYYKI